MGQGKPVAFFKLLFGVNSVHFTITVGHGSTASKLNRYYLIMEKGFTEKEKEFFKRQQNNGSKLKTIFIVAGLILFLGVLLDALSGFSILRNSKSVFHGVIGLIVITAIYLSVEGLLTKINSKDKVSHPLHIRLFHLLLLIMVVIGFILIGNWVLNFISI